MGYLDRVLGRKQEAAAPQQAPQEAPQVEQAAPSAKQEMTHDTGASFGPPKLELPATIPSAIPGQMNMETLASPSGKFYDPYEGASVCCKAACVLSSVEHALTMAPPPAGISSGISTKKHTFRLPQQLEFVFEEEAAVRRRGWTENLQFYTGTGYLGGAREAWITTSVRCRPSSARIANNVLNFCRGGCGRGSRVVQVCHRQARHPPGPHQAQAEPRAQLVRWGVMHAWLLAPKLLPCCSSRLAWQHALTLPCTNLAGSKAKPFSNGAGIMGLYFASLESFLTNYIDAPGVPDAVNTIAAGEQREGRG